MNSEEPMVLEIDCTTGQLVRRMFTPEEIAQRSSGQAAADREEQRRESQLAEDLALMSWISDHPELPEAAKRALTRMAQG